MARLVESMARRRSEEKRIAILHSALAAVAEHGIGASTRDIAKRAEVSEGAVFTYFPTKDVLLNEVYVSLKTDLAVAIAPEFPRRAGVEKQMRHIWNRSVAWAVAHPRRHFALRQLAVWGGLEKTSVARGEAAHVDLTEVMVKAKSLRVFRDLPDELLLATSAAIQDMTIDFTLRHPKEAARYREAGFELLWRAVTATRT